jgi:hypothetical protein
MRCCMLTSWQVNSVGGEVGAPRSCSSISLGSPLTYTLVLSCRGNTDTGGTGICTGTALTALAAALVTGTARPYVAPMPNQHRTGTENVLRREYENVLYRMLSYVYQTQSCFSRHCYLADQSRWHCGYRWHVKAGEHTYCHCLMRKMTMTVEAPFRLVLTALHLSFSRIDRVFFCVHMTKLYQRSQA